MLGVSGGGEVTGCVCMCNKKHARVELLAGRFKNVSSKSRLGPTRSPLKAGRLVGGGRGGQTSDSSDVSFPGCRVPGGGW